MSTAIILGNTNQFTFANSIIAANNKSFKLFDEVVENIFVIHSSASFKILSQKIEWIEHLKINNINRGKLTEKIIDLDNTPDTVEAFVQHIEFIVNGAFAKNQKLIVDLTNSTSLYKNLLSTAAYILDLEHQYLIDIVRVSELTEERKFLPLDILQATYLPVPNAIQLDSIAYLSLVEMVRYKRIIQKHTERYIQIGTTHADKELFEKNLVHSVQIKLQGDQKKINAIYRIAASSISTSVENLITVLINRFFPQNKLFKDNKNTFGQKLGLIQSRMEGKTPTNFDFEFFRRFNDFMLYLRNSSVHKDTSLTNIDKFKADLSVKMSFPFIEFYTDIIYPLLAQGDYTSPPKKIKNLSATTVKPGDIFYFGLDGDNTGAILEDLFLLSSDEAAFKKMSKSVVTAIEEISRFIKNNTSKEAIIFAAGDDILFKAEFDESLLCQLQKMYYETTSGLTCSIGYGKSLREVYLALKIAKMEPGKSCIRGIELI